MRAPLWTSQDIAAATNGRQEGPDFCVAGITIDSRSIEPGDLFIALAGIRNGHEFVGTALSNGAAGSLVSKPVEGPHILVGDVQAALGDLASAARDRALKTQRIAITGSVGKTSVTQAIAAALRLAGKTHAPVKSFNNHIGVPLTLARMPSDIDFAVFELGMNHPGEISPLSRLVKPDVAVITLVGPVHVENFPTGERGVATAKAEIFDGMKKGTTAVLNRDSRWFEMMVEAARLREAEVVSFGTRDGADFQVLDFRPHNGGAAVRARLRGQDIDILLAQPGPHWGSNALATILAVESVGAPIGAALEALANFRPLDGRGAEYEILTPSGTACLIDDSYNANPISMRAAFMTLAGKSVAGRRIAVLTDMLELGHDALEVHAALAADISRAGIDLVFAAGPLMEGLFHALPGGKQGAWAETARALAPVVLTAVHAGDAIVVKGSKGSQASLIAEALRAGCIGRAPV